MVMLNNISFTFIGLMHVRKGIYVSFILIPKNSINIRLHLGFQVSLAMLTQKVRK